MKPIGLIHSPFRQIDNMPIQSIGASKTKGHIRIFEEYLPGLKDLDGFSHIWAIYEFHENKDYKLTVTPFLDNCERGVFATRAPKRPNPIGLSVFKIDTIDHDLIYVSGVDVLDQTPLLDIKPYVAKFDIVEDARSGWLEKVMENAGTMRSDKRFK